MWSWAPTGTRPTRGRDEKKLAEFAKLEYGTSEIGWLFAQSRRRWVKGFRARIRSWIVRHVAKRSGYRGELRERITADFETSVQESSVSPTDLLNAPDSVIMGDGGDVEGFCTHPALEYLGSGGSASYQRCLKCGSVLMARGGREVMTTRTEGSVPALIEIE